MYKKIFALVLNIFMLAGLCNAAEVKSTDTIKGVTQLEKKMSLTFINKLQATADNDGITFASQWPDEYFDSSNKYSYMYVVANNENDTLELVMFNISQTKDNCFKGDSPNFCIPTISPSIEKYSYKNRFLAEITPDFIENRNNFQKSEILTKDGKYFDTKNLTLLKKAPETETYTECSYDKNGNVEKCQTFNKESDELVYTEKLDRKPNLPEVENIYRYIKYSADENKMEEYYYSNGKHIFYDKDGEVKRFIQYNNDKFKFYDTELPDLYIETVFVRDDKGRVVEEQIYDRNHRVVRNYQASYKEDNTIDNIVVKDSMNNAEWTILPIGINDIVNLPFKIRM